MSKSEWVLLDSRPPGPGEFFACERPEAPFAERMLFHQYRCEACRLAVIAGVRRGELESSALERFGIE